MPSTGDLQYPSSVFTTVRQTFQVLESAEVNPEKFMQALRDKPEFRKQVVDAYNREFPTVLFGVPSQPKNLEDFTYFATGLRNRNLEKERREFAKYPYSRADEVLAEYAEENQEYTRYLELFSNHDIFTKMFEGLDEQGVSIIVAKLGLKTGKGMTFLATAKAHSIAAARCRTLFSRAASRLKANAEALNS